MADMGFFTEDVRTSCINSYKHIWREHYNGMKTAEIIHLEHNERNQFEYYMILGLYYPDICYNQMDIAIPPNIHYSTYIRNNILHYTDLECKSPDKSDLLMIADVHTVYEKLQDNVLINILGGYPFFNNRPTLVSNIISMLHVKSWFILIFPDKEKINNKDNITTNLSTIEELKDDGEIVLAYGTESSYSIYELDELHKAIHFDDEHKIWIFTNPQGDYFRLLDLYRLLELLTMIVEINDEARLLFHHVCRALEENKSYSSEERELKIDYENQSEDEKKSMLSFLEAVFYMGMYMRRWEGPGHPYPVKERDTRSEDLSYEVKIKECVDVLSNMLKEPSIVYRLYTIDDNKKEGSFVGLFDKVKKCQYCIRSASKRFIATAVWYRLLLMGEAWPDVDINTIDRIV